MCTPMLHRIHSSHQGPVACVRRARDVTFWPGLTKEIIHLASQCSTCNEYAAKQQKEPLRAIDATNHSNCTIVFGSTKPIYILVMCDNGF